MKEWIFGLSLVRTDLEMITPQNDLVKLMKQKKKSRIV